ncbi:MAG: formaldehyde-activating enzyme [Halobacteriota archaeon]
MAEKIIENALEFGTRIGEALVGEMPELAHIDIALGQKGGAFETAFLTALATPRMGHTALLAILAPNYAVKPATLMVNKVTIKGEAQAELMFGPVQAAIAKAVLDSVQERVIAAAFENELLIIASVYINGNAADKNKLFDFNYKATKLAISNAMRQAPTVDELLQNKDTIVHPLM